MGAMDGIFYKNIRLYSKRCFTIADKKEGILVIPLKQFVLFWEYELWLCDYHPYMGLDSVSPFLEFKNKWVHYCFTSNKSSSDFQKLEGINGKLFEKVIEISKHWGSETNMMYVIG